jgi:hypothetical protein
MSEVVVALGGGILFALVAVVGGGFTVKEIVIPKVPNWARVVSGAVGAFLLALPFVLTTLGERIGQDTAPSAEGGL